MVANKIREWDLPFITLTEETYVPPELTCCLDYIRVNRIERSISNGWKSVFEKINDVTNSLITNLNEMGRAAKEVLNEKSNTSK